MSRPLKIAAAVTVAAAVVAATWVILARNAAPELPQWRPSSAPEYPRRAAGGQARFAFSLFQELRNRAPEENTVSSPLSIRYCLGMVYNAADGETKTAMATALSLEDPDPETLNAENAALLHGLTSSGIGADISIANAMVVDDTIEAQPAFREIFQKHYGHQPTTFDLQNPLAVRWINSWVSANTEERITRLIDRLDPQDVMVLLNAMYFQAEWETPFEVHMTQPADFTLFSGDLRPVPMMHLSGVEFPYFENAVVRAVSLPYAGERLSMVVMLPHADLPFSDFCEGFEASTWEDMLAGMAREELDLGLPRFGIDTLIDLEPALTALGMGVAFEPGAAEFPHLVDSDMPIWISQARHAARIDVDEKGTVAAAATGAGMAGGPSAPPRPFVVDRPFVCAIRDSQTGAILFLGAIVDPSPVRATRRGSR